jgi:hypothetical protein
MTMTRTELSAAIQCLTEARKSILVEWPLTDQNEWAETPPPPNVCDALHYLDAAHDHLVNLSESLAD